jgi:hypothetical protein
MDVFNWPHAVFEKRRKWRLVTKIEYPFSIIDTCPDLTLIKFNIWAVSSIGKISVNSNCSLDDSTATSALPPI